MKEIVLGKRKKTKVKMFDRKKMDEITRAAETTNELLEVIRALVPLGLKTLHEMLWGEGLEETRLIRLGG